MNRKGRSPCGDTGGQASTYQHSASRFGFYQGSSLEEIQSALNSLFPDCDRDSWLKIAMALKSGLGEDGFQLFDKWSQGGASYDAKACKDTWKSIQSGGGVKIKTLFKLANDAGWRWSQEGTRPTVAKNATVDSSPSLASQKDKEAQAARNVVKIWTAATEAANNHPYLINKKFRPTFTMREMPLNKLVELLGYHPKGKAGPLQGDRILIIPIKVEGKFSTIEMIDGDGRKTALAGGKKAGGYWATQTLPEGDGMDLVFLVGEGVATVSSAVQDTKGIGIATFSNTNLEAVAKGIKARYPKATIIILADLIKATGKPDSRAIEACKAVCGRLAIPDFGPDRQEGYTDFNDLHRVCGEEAVQQQFLALDAIVSKPTDDTTDEQDALKTNVFQDIFADIESTDDERTLIGSVAQKVTQSGLLESEILILRKKIAKKSGVSVVSLEKDAASDKKWKEKKERTRRQQEEKAFYARHSGECNQDERGAYGPHLDASREVIEKQSGKENFLYDGRGFYSWDEKGVWRATEDRKVRQIIHTVKTGDDLKKNDVESILDLTRTESFRSNHRFNVNNNSINFTNGELHFLNDEWVLKPHNRENYRTNQVPVDYDSGATAPRFSQFLKEIFADDEDALEKATLILEFMGYSLLPTCRYEKFLLMIGNGANGKSVLLSVVESLMGSENVCAVQPSQFDNRFQRAYLDGKMVNLVTEIAEGAVIPDAQLKAIVSGELTTAEHKFKPPFDFKPLVKCWFGTNHLPHTRDFSNALFRRALMVSFNRKFEGKNCDPKLKEKLTKELPGILNLALDAVSVVLDKERFTTPKSSEDLKNQWRKESDQCQQFVDEMCELSPGEKTSSKAMWNAYQEWTKEWGIKTPLNRNSFTKRLKIFNIIDKKGSQGERMLHGIRILPGGA